MCGCVGVPKTEPSLLCHYQAYEPAECVGVWECRTEPPLCHHQAYEPADPPEPTEAEAASAAEAIAAAKAKAKAKAKSTMGSIQFGADLSGLPPVRAPTVSTTFQHESPRIVVKCSPRASNGPNYLGMCALRCRPVGGAGCLRRTNKCRSAGGRSRGCCRRPTVSAGGNV